ncbi:IS4 family transposase [Crocinitomix catalasitica]|nr:IS4 family transposase [Crocinitomix catalasitica]
MNKSTFFTGQPILTQLLSFIDKRSVKAIARKANSDYYYKSFDTHTHLVTMLYCVLNKCNSSREVVSGMKACEHKLYHLGIKKAPGRSTLCEGNKNRSCEVFEQIYQMLYQRYRHFLPDSRINSKSKLFIADSSTITLFQEIFKAPSMAKMNGKRKGGIKVHTLISSEEDVAVKVNFSHARANDMTFLKEINLETGAFIVFDKGYVDYSQYQRFSNEGVFFVTRQRKGASYHDIGINDLNQNSIDQGVRADRTIILGTRTHAKKIRIKARLITFYDAEKDRNFEFLTNNFILKAEQIAQIYKKRWQIEILFKRVKQNFPLKYFLGDNENAIKIQIWAAFIADLLIKIVQSQLKRKWAFSNLTSIVRLHLMSYIDLFKFLNNPDKLIPVKINHQLEIKGLEIGFKT